MGANDGLTARTKDSANLNPINNHIVTRELLAVRAYMPFDLMRLYGYGNWAGRSTELNSKMAVPYVTGVSKDITSQTTGAETIKLLLADLNEAAAQLKDYDPITGKHDASFYSEVNDDGYWKNRTLHLNYYAVKALLARVYMWEGSEASKTKALAAAEEVIAAVKSGINMSDMNTYCYLLGAQAVNSSTATMAVESLFKLDVTSLASKITGYIKPGYVDTDYAAMFLAPSDATALYENSTSDVRFTQLLGQSTSSSTMGYVPLKVYQGSSLGDLYKNKISMIRIPELYYIAAECYATAATPDRTKAMDLLNTIRESRGVYDKLSGLTAAQVMDEIGKEYHKEFLSEG